MLTQPYVLFSSLSLRTNTHGFYPEPFESKLQARYAFTNILQINKQDGFRDRCVDEASIGDEHMTV